MLDPRIAVVVPISPQPALAVEAIESVLRQQTSFDFRLVAVNDGCPYEEAEHLGRTYTAAHPRRFLYFRRPHGGLSAARNTGIDVALRTWPSVEAVLLLGPEDRLGPRALEVAYQALCQHPKAAWVFPDVQHLSGSRHYANTSGAWSVLELLDNNYAAHGCLVRRQVFEQGFRYHEGIRPEAAAWDLWLRCAAAGLSGCHVPGVEFLHRRTGSATPSAGPHSDEQDHAWLRDRHAAWFTQRRALLLEQDEFPRYAIYLCDTGRVVLTTDPCVPLTTNCQWHQNASFPATELASRLLRARASPTPDRFPARFVVTSEAFLRTAAAGRFAAGLFWLAQLRLERQPIDILTVRLHQRMSTDYCLQIVPAERSAPPRVGVGFALLSSHFLDECLWDAGGHWLRSLMTRQPPARMDGFDVRFARPRPPTEVPADVLERLIDLLAAAGPVYRRASRCPPLPAPKVARADGDGCRLMRRLFHRAALYPHLPKPSCLHLGFATHVCDFGGSERVILNLAREARRHGWAPHLCVAGSSVARLLREFESVFESITVVDRWEDWYTDAMVGLLGAMDVVVAFNCWLFNEAMAPLRRLGVKTFTLLHSVGIVTASRPNLVSFDTVRWQQDLDGVMVISNKLRRWCAAHGIPREKLVYLPNAPSFAASDALIDTTLMERTERTSRQPLRVLFLGRFDPEKGMDRLTALIGEAARRGLPLEWQVVGRKVIDTRAAEVDLRPLEPFLRPPALSAAALGRYYRWADVVVMLSRLEGVPLTILEAQRFGCVVLSTKVGAVAEAVEHGRTGFLFDNEADNSSLVNAMLHTLQELHADRGRLLAVAHASAALRREATWARTFASFARAVEAA